jgi:RNA-directed DNA polymerase
VDIKLKQTDEELIKKFNDLQTIQDVSSLLEVRKKDIIYLLQRNKHSNYKEFEISKKSGGMRRISAPISSLKILQQKLCYILTLVYKPKQVVHGFIQICCHDNCLPQGGPTSPIISNLISSKLDNTLREIAQKHKCFYTRYADDITFSTNKKNFPVHIAITSEINKTSLNEEVHEAIRNNGFDVNESKVRLHNKTQRLEVTGLTVNKSVNLRREFIRQVWAMLHAWEKFGKENAEMEYHSKYMKRNRLPEKAPPRFDNVVRGKINYIRMVRGEEDLLYRKLANKFNSLAGLVFPQYHFNRNDEITSAIWVLECEESIKQGTGFFLEGVGLITCAHVVGSSTVAFKHSDLSKKYKTRVLYNSDDIDVAVLEIIDPPKKLPFLKPLLSKKILRQGLEVTVAGFPNYRDFDSPYICTGHITAYRGFQKRYLISASIVAGNSGGPILNSDNLVIGIAVTGAKSLSETSMTEDHGVIPINLIDYLF